jgi:hypothetical protein
LNTTSSAWSRWNDILCINMCYFHRLWLQITKSLHCSMILLLQYAFYVEDILQSAIKCLLRHCIVIYKRQTIYCLITLRVCHSQIDVINLISYLYAVIWNVDITIYVTNNWLRPSDNISSSKISFAAFLSNKIYYQRSNLWNKYIKYILRWL